MKDRQDKPGAFQTFKSLFKTVGIIPGIKRWLIQDFLGILTIARSGVLPT